MESRKMVLMNLPAGKEQTHRHRKQTCGHSKVRQTEQAVLTYIHYLVKQIASGKLLYNTGSSAWCSVTTCSGGMGMAVGEKFKRKGTHVYLWLIHVVWQKPTQHCEAIILQFKKQNLFCLKTNMHEILTHNHGKVFNFSWKFPSSPFLNLNYHKEKNYFFTHCLLN